MESQSKTPSVRPSKVYDKGPSENSSAMPSAKPSDVLRLIPSLTPRASPSIPPNHSLYEQLNQAPRLTPLHLRGRYNNKDNNDCPTMRGSVRVETVEKITTGNESSYPGTEYLTDTQLHGL